MSKFESPMAEWLYQGAEFDEEIGDSSSGVGWAGKYTFQGIEGGVILFEKVSGEVHMAQYRSTAELEVAWYEATELLDMDRGEPEEGDWVVQDVPGGYIASQYGKATEFTGLNGIDHVLRYISAIMDQDEFWPDVWHVSDHGNYTLLDLKEMGIRHS